MPAEESTFEGLTMGYCFEHLIEKALSATSLLINNMNFFTNLQDINGNQTTQSQVSAFTTHLFYLLDLNVLQRQISPI